MNDDFSDLGQVCSKCEMEMGTECEVLPYDDKLVCEICYDKLRILDEVEVQTWETEGYDYE